MDIIVSITGAFLISTSRIAGEHLVEIKDYRA